MKTLFECVAVPCPGTEVVEKRKQYGKQFRHDSKHKQHQPEGIKLATEHIKWSKQVA